MTNDKKKTLNYKQRDKRVEIQHELSSMERSLTIEYKKAKTRREKNKIFIKGVKRYGWK